MIKIGFMDKSRAHELMPELFELLYANMNEIDPAGEDHDSFKEEWLFELIPAVMKPARRIVLIEDEEKLIGYFQYYVNADTFMMEEIQFVKERQGTGLFRELYRFLRDAVPADIEFAEAYALNANLRSQAILTHIGLEPIGESANGRCIHYRGDCKAMFGRILKQKAEDKAQQA